VQLVEEPLVDVGHLPDLVDTVAAMERRRNSKEALVGGVDELFVDVLDKVILEQNS
jgi:hypothetical protein